MIIERKKRFMNRTAALVVPAALLATLLASLGAHAQNPQRGVLIYETHCGTCHYERVFERPPARSLVKSRTALQVQVERWATQTKHRFTPEDIQDVVEYLDRAHYKFAK